MTEPSEDTDLSLDEALQRAQQPLAEDPGGPYLFVDLYPFDLGPMPPWEAAIRNPLIYGAILKATDGVAYSYTAWFHQNFTRLAWLARDRRGSSFFIGGYHYLQFALDGAQQAAAYLGVMKMAGWGERDIVPIVDVEFGGERAANRRASTQQIIDCVSAFAERVKVATGRRVMLYGRSVMRDRKIFSKMGCDQVWNPAYTPRMVVNGLTVVDEKPGPWKLDDIVMWQHVGDGVGDAHVHHLPLELVGFGKVDMSVAIDGTRRPTLARLHDRLL
jgi:GH25 family lysozyme M1 (1,4-beta-N-acetylmuramidase)